MRFVAGALLLALCLGCTPKLDLPPAKTLQASPEELARIPGYLPGPHATDVIAATPWPLGEETLRVRVVQPRGEGPYPLVVFSHGFASDSDQYDAVLNHWASHGYLSIAPSHPDSGGTPRAIWASLVHGKDGLIETRLRQLHLILNNLHQLDALQPGLAQRIDTGRIIAAGHSFGAFSAQQLGGAAAIDPEKGTRIEGRDPRVRAVVAISPPGEMFGLINAESWQTMAVPMLATTGTWDMDGRFVTDWRQHRLSYETAPPGRNWLLVVEGADHYLGNLICRLERDAVPQTDALKIVNAASTQFMVTQVSGAPPDTWSGWSELSQISQGFARTEQR